MKDNVLQEANLAKSAKGGSASKKKVNKITNWVKQIAKKVPEVNKLEQKLGMLQGLDPVLEGIVTDLEKVTDYSHLMKLKK